MNYIIRIDLLRTFLLVLINTCVVWGILAQEQKMELVAKNDLTFKVTDLQTQLVKSKVDIKIPGFQQKEIDKIEIIFTRFLDEVNCCNFKSCDCKPEYNCNIEEERKKCCDECFEPIGLTSVDKIRNVDLIPGQYQATFYSNGVVLKSEFKIDEGGKKYVFKFANKQ